MQSKNTVFILLTLFIIDLLFNKYMSKTRSKRIRTISLTTYSRSAILVLMTKENLPVVDAVNDEVKKKSARYATSQIDGQSTIQNSKSRSSKRDLVINTQREKKEMTTNAKSASICSISKGKTPIIVFLSITKNSVLQKKPKRLKQTIFAKRTTELQSSKSVRKQKSYWKIILLLTLLSDKTALLILLNQPPICKIQYLNCDTTNSSSKNY